MKCAHCNLEKEQRGFSINRRNKTGMSAVCRDCISIYRKEKSVRIQKMRNGEIVIDKRIPKGIRKDFSRNVAIELMANPDITQREIAKKLDLSEGTIREYFRSNNFIRALRILSSHKMTEYLPLAVNGYRDSLKSSSAEVKFRAALELLKSENIFGPEKVQVEVDDLRQRPVEELREIIDRARTIPKAVFDAEVIG